MPTAVAWASRSFRSRTSRQPMALAKRVTLASLTPALRASSLMLAAAAPERSSSTTCATFCSARRNAGPRSAMRVRISKGAVMAGKVQGLSKGYNW